MPRSAKKEATPSRHIQWLVSNNLGIRLNDVVLFVIGEIDPSGIDSQGGWSVKPYFKTSVDIDGPTREKYADWAAEIVRRLGPAFSFEKLLSTLARVEIDMRRKTQPHFMRNRPFDQLLILGHRLR
jgi:hypothetical protein